MLSDNAKRMLVDNAKRIRKWSGDKNPSAKNNRKAILDNLRKRSDKFVSNNAFRSKVLLEFSFNWRSKRMIIINDAKKLGLAVSWTILESESKMAPRMEGPKGTLLAPSRAKVIDESLAKLTKAEQTVLSLGLGIVKQRAPLSVCSSILGLTVGEVTKLYKSGLEKLLEDKNLRALE